MSEHPVARLGFDNPDYTDEFELTPAKPFESIDHFVSALALNQPGWLIRLSTGISGRSKLQQAVDGLRTDRLPAIGNWKLVERTDTTATFAEDMKVMRYRLLYTWEAPDRIRAETEVVQQSRWFGPIYWALATPMHRRFLPMMMRNAGGPGSVTQTVR